MILLQIFTIIAIVVLGGIIKLYFPSYLKKKGENLATKEDIEEITHKIETVKKDLERLDRIENKKYELKYNAILTSLKLTDSRLSNFIIDDNIKKQYATTEETRECHSRLIISCNNSKIIESFENLMMQKLSTGSEGTQNIIKELEKYRNLIREELGFGQIKTNPNLIWIASVPFEKKKTSENKK